MVSREAIELALKELNEAENSTELDAAGKSAVIDRLCSEGCRGWANGTSRGGRAEEREQELALWSTFPDYHRTFERIIIDPPHAAIQWRLTGGNPDLDMSVDVYGVSIMRFDDDARLDEFWLLFHDPLAT